MSNLWSSVRAAEAASVGSFAIHRNTPLFTPWAGDEEGHDPCDEPAGEMVQTVDAIRADAFAEGFDQGRRTIELELAGEREALARLAESLDALRPEPPAHLAALIAETVERLVRQIVGEVGVDAALLVRRAEAAAAMLSEETAPSRVRVNPADVDLLAGARVPTMIVGDDSLMRGSVVIESGSGWIEDGPEVRLDRLRSALDRLGAA